MYARGSEVETTKHFLLRCHLFSPQRLKLFENFEKVDSSFLNLNFKHKVSFIIWFSINNFQKLQLGSFEIVINHITETGPFDRHLICPNH